MFCILQTEEEIFFSNQCAQGKISFQGGSWRTDAYRRFGRFQQITKMTFPRIGCNIWMAVEQRLSDAFRTVDKTVTEAPAVTEKIAVNLAVLAVDNPPEFSVAFAGSGVAAQAAMHTN
jgi:hypothetical protein